MKKTIKLTEQADTIGIQIHIAGRIDRKKKLRVWNGLEKVRFPCKPFELKSIIVPVQFERDKFICRIIITKYIQT